MKEFEWILGERDGRVRQIYNGVVQSLSRVRGIVAPGGWQEMLIAWERMMTRYGQVKNYSLPMEFVLDAATILRNDSYKFNVDRELYLSIYRLVTEVDPSFFKTYYKFMYKGQLDFSTFDDKQGEGFVVMNIMEGGIAKFIKAVENFKFNIPFDSDASVLVNDGLEIQERIKVAIVSTISNSDFLNTHTLAVAFIAKEGQGTGVAVHDTNVESVGGDAPGYCAASSNYFADNEFGISPTTVRIVGQLKFKCTNNDIDAAYRCFFMSNTGTQYDFYNPAVTLVENETYTIDVDETITIPVGQKLFALGRYFGLFGGGATDVTIEWLENSFLDVEFVSRAAATETKFFFPDVLFRKLIAKATGSEANAALSSCLTLSTIGVTSGDAIRGINDTGVTLSLNEFLNNYIIYEFGGFGIENKLAVFEGRDHFFNQLSPRNVGEFADFNPVLATELLHSRIKVGHAEQEVDEVNGRYDPNGWQLWKTGIKSTDTELNLQGTWKAGPFEIERIRINYDGKTTTDSQKDAQLFILDVNRTADVDGKFHFDRSEIPTSGVPFPASIFNVRLSPRHILNKHIPWLAGMTHQYNTGKIEFDNGNRNDDMITPLVTPKAAIQISTIASQKMFLPYYLIGKPQSDIALLEQMNLNINSSFYGTWNRSEYYGFLLRYGIAPNTLKTQELKMLAAPNNDLINLI